MSDRCDVLVVAAFLPELAGLEAMLGVELSKRVGALHVRAATVGVGLVSAACGTMAVLETCDPRVVVLVGTCGVYPQNGSPNTLSVGDVVVARSARLVAPEAAEGRAAIPDVMPTRLGAHGSLTASVAGGKAPLVDVVTTLAVTTDDPLALVLGKEGAVEHLEAFAVALACEKKALPFTAVLGVANRVGSSGRSEWRANHESAGRAAAGLVAEWLDQGVARIPTT